MNRPMKTASVLATALLLAACGVEPDATPPVASERSAVDAQPLEGAAAGAEAPGAPAADDALAVQTPAPDAMATDNPATSAADAGSAAVDGTAPPAADVFLANLRPLCGKAFAGRVVADTPA